MFKFLVITELHVPQRVSNCQKFAQKIKIKYIGFLK